MSRGSPCAQLPPLPSPLQDPPQTWHPWLGAPDTRDMGRLPARAPQSPQGCPPRTFMPASLSLWAGGAKLTLLLPMLCGLQPGHLCALFPW